MDVCRRRVFVLAQVVAVVMPTALAKAQDIRIVSWNTEDDVTGSSGFNANLNAGTDTVLEGIDSYTGPYTSPSTSGALPAQTIDILGLEETSFNTSTKIDTTATAIVSDLNTYATSIGSSAVYESPSIPTSAQIMGIGNGPNALVYNSTTMTLLASTAITGTGIDRPVMRYEFQPVGGLASQVFYVYVSHMKSSGSDSGSALTTDETKRNEEAQAIRANAATLGSASIIYMGDFNMSGTSSTTEPAYQTLTQSTASGTYSTGAGVDPANLANNYNVTWDDAPAYASLFSETAKKLQYRDDIQFMTNDIYNDTGALDYVSNSEVPFGNNGTAGVKGNVTHSSGTGISAAVLSALATASDHLPIVSDYSFTIPLLLGDANGDGKVDSTDLNIVLSNLGIATSLRSQGNFDGAATIDLNDLNDVLNNLGTSVNGGSSAASPQPVPEPASLLSIGAGLVFISLRRRRAV